MKVKQIVEKTQMRDEALNTLRGLGLLIPFDARVHAYHGRTNADGAVFHVISKSDEMEQNVGSYYVEKMQGLHTSDFETAKKYANIRTKQFNQNIETSPELMAKLSQGIIKKGTPEVHRIVAANPDLSIFDVCKIYDIDDFVDSIKSYFYDISQEEIDEIYKYQLTNDEREKMKAAVCKLAKSYSIEDIMPELFDDENGQKVLGDLLNVCKQNKKKSDLPFVLDENVEDYVMQKANNNPQMEELSKAIAGAVNVYNILSENGDLPLIIRKIQSQFDFYDDCTLNLKFAQKFLEKQNIVGLYQKIWSSELINQNNFGEYFFFDTSKIKAEEVVKLQPQEGKKVIKQKTHVA